MPQFRIISNLHDIALSNEWVEAKKFRSKGVSQDFAGHRYQLIAKRERYFSFLERVGRAVLGILAIIFTAGYLLREKSIVHLVTKDHEAIRFGVLLTPQKPPTIITPTLPPEAIVPTRSTVPTKNTPKVYVDPTLLYGGAKLQNNCDLNFALIDQELVPVVQTTQYGRQYSPFNGSVLEALFLIAKNSEFSGSVHVGRHYDSPVMHFLKHPQNKSLTEEQFFKFILEKDAQGCPRLCMLNELSTIEVLTILKEKNIQIDLHEKTPEGTTLFTRWAKKGSYKILKLLLERDPTIIKQTLTMPFSPFSEEVLKGHREIATLLLDALTAQGINLASEELWMKRALLNDCDFPDTEFLALNQPQKTAIYYAANTFAGDGSLVRKLRDLGMQEAPVLSPGPSIFAANNDLLTTQQVMQDFLKDLRAKELLLTHEEFSKLDEGRFIEKSGEIGRIAGKFFIEKVARENGLKSIKVPRKIAVLAEGIPSISFRLSKGLEMRPQKNGLRIYAERITPVKRNLSLEEGIEYMIALEKTGFNDFGGENIFIAEDGTYFIDTEQYSFDPNNPVFSAIEQIKDLLKPEDRPAFLKKFKERKAAFEKDTPNREALAASYKQTFWSEHKILSNAYKDHDFEFAVNDLISSGVEVRE